MFGYRNLGYFEIPMMAFEYLDIINEAMQQVVILRADFHFDDRCMHYFGIGPFEDVEDCMHAPHYNIVCDDRLTEKPLRFVKGTPNERVDWLTVKIHNCLICYDTHEVTCNRCSGSGEGQADGSKCLVCNGGGVIPCACKGVICGD